MPQHIDSDAGLGGLDDEFVDGESVFVDEAKPRRSRAIATARLVEDKRADAMLIEIPLSEHSIRDRLADAMVDDDHGRLSANLIRRDKMPIELSWPARHVDSYERYR